MNKYVNPRCPKLARERKMSGRGGMVSVWFVEHKCRLDFKHTEPCDFTRGKRLGKLTSEARDERAAEEGRFLTEERRLTEAATHRVDPPLPPPPVPARSVHEVTAAFNADVRTAGAVLDQRVAKARAEYKAIEDQAYDDFKQAYEEASQRAAVAYQAAKVAS